MCPRLYPNKREELGYPCKEQERALLGLEPLRKEGKWMRNLLLEIGQRKFLLGIFPL